MDIAWDSELAQFLTDLSTVQEETLQLLTAKRELLVHMDAAGLAALAPREETLIARLQQCLDRREQLLQRAAGEGLPASDLQTLAKAIPGSQRRQVDAQLQSAASRTRLLRHHSLTNWVLVQRTLLHLGQMLEIIATGGRLRPTYEKGKPSATPGSLMDWAA